MDREPAKTEHAAEQRYTRFINQGLACITKQIWVASPPMRGGETEDRLLYLPGGFTRLRRDDDSSVYLRPTQSFRLIPDPDFPGEWKAQTREYNYTVLETEGRGSLRRVLAWHWHPDSPPMREPHVHVYMPGTACDRDVSRLHLPSGRTAFEQVVLFLVDEMGVRTLRLDWREVVQQALDRFVRWRTWPRTARRDDQ